MRQESKIGVVILNFRNYLDTISCVDSILLQKNVNYEIVIVDNGSKNESAEILKNKYESVEHVTLLMLDENLGYAKGNNAGIEILHGKKCDYIVIANSDLKFTSSNILRQLIDADEKDVGLLIPIIRNLDGSIEQRVAYKRKFFLIRMIKCIVMAQIKRLKFIFLKKAVVHHSNEVIEFYKAQLGIQKDFLMVSGSCFMLTPSFFQHYRYLFPETFLYFEEWATSIFLYKAGLFSKVVETDVILHKGAASTSSVIKKNKVVMAAQSGRRLFKLIFMSRSMIEKKYCGG